MIAHYTTFVTSITESHMKTVIKLTPDQVRLLKEHGTVVNLGATSEYYYLPFWFQKTGAEWEILTFDRLPPELSDFIKHERNSAGNLSKIIKALILFVFLSACHSTPVKSVNKQDSVKHMSRPRYEATPQLKMERP